MTETIQFIVSCLNDPPFHKRLRLIDFDEKPRHELLQILIDVFVSIDPKLNSNFEYYFNGGNGGGRMNEILSFLSILQYKNLPLKQEEEMQSWTEHLLSGDKEIIYSILEFCFSQYDKLKKRAYLAPFLTPIQLPLDVSMTQRDDSLKNLANRYQSLQEEFKEVHKLYEEMKDNSALTGIESMREEVESLKEEKSQLLTQVEVLESNASNDSTFLRLLNAIRTLRKEEEEEMNLRDRIKDQKGALAEGETKLKHLQQQIASLQAIGSADGGSPDAIMNEIHKQLAEVTMVVKSDLVSKRNEWQRKINDIEINNEDDKSYSEDDLDSIRETVKELREEYETKQQRLEEEQSKKSYKKILMYKQHAIAAKKKLKAKEFDIKRKTKELNTLRESVEVHERSVDNKDKQKSSKQDEVVDADEASLIESKLAEQEKLKRNVAEMQHESLILQRTVDILRSRHHNIEKFMSEQEERANAKGFHDAQKTLQNTVKNVAEIDERKGQTLQEISEMITKITEKLNVERERLQPMIQELKQTRAEFQNVEDEYQRNKKRFDKMSSRLAADRQQLEKECDELQEEWQEEERNYHYLMNSNEVVKVNLEKVQMEENWRNGVEKMLPDFNSLHDLYQNKLIQQENLAKQLRIDQRSLKENESEKMKQRQLFGTLKRIMDIKMNLKIREHNIEINENEDSIIDQINNVETLSF